MDLRASSDSDPRVFVAVASAVHAELGGAWTEQLDGLDQRYWDLLVDDQQLTVHLDHVLGTFLCFTPGTPVALVERAAAAVPHQDDWTIQVSFSGLFCPGFDPDRPDALSLLTDDNNHIHGALEIRVQGRLLPRLGFWGPHDVCLNTWLAELHGAVRELDTSREATFTFDEGEQGQPLFKFHRNSAVLLVSVEDSLLSDGPGDLAWSAVPCAYEDFRFQIFRFSGMLRSELERELGEERTEAWLRGINGRITQVCS